MRIALLSDVHGNAAALTAVLRRIEESGIERIFALGDLVGRGPEPGRVVSMLRERAIPSLRGNWDDWVAGGDGWDTRPKRKLWVEAARARMSDDELAHLASLPETLRLVLGGHRVLLAHGSPRDVMELLVPETSEQQLREAIAGAEAEVIVVGHSHRPFTRWLDGRLVVNVGTVGYSFDGDPRASLCLLDLSAEPRVELLRVPYRLERNLTRMQRLAKAEVVPAPAALKYRRALLGDEPVPMEPLDPSDRGAELAVKLLAAPARALCMEERFEASVAGALGKPEPSLLSDAAELLGAVGWLRGALRLARPVLRRKRALRLSRAVERLREAGRDYAAAVARAHALQHAPETSPALRERAWVRVQRKARKLLPRLERARVIDLGLAVLAAAMRARDEVLETDRLLVAPRRPPSAAKVEKLAALEAAGGAARGARADLSRTIDTWLADQGREAMLERDSRRAARLAGTG